MTTRGEINSNFYQIVNVDANGAPTSVKPEYLGNISNVANANYANFANIANTANTANIANSVSVANVSGIGNIATINLTGSSSNVLYGNGVFAAIPTVSNVANANYANFAGNAFSVNAGNIVGTVNLANYATVANSVAVANVSGIGNIATVNLTGSTSNVLYGNGTFAAIPTISNVANANYANFAGTAFSVSGSNVSGQVANANYSNYSNVANTANSVAVANVVGIGNIATINLDGNVSNVLSGNGTFVALPTVSANSNYANFAGNVVNSAQPNITSLGTLTSLTVSGNASIGNINTVDSILFDTANSPGVTTVAQLDWDDGDGTLELLMKGGNVTQQIGTQEFARVYNAEATTLNKGEVVYVFGAQGNRLSVKRAQADTEATSFGTVGFVAESIASGAEGFIITSGALYKLNTNGLTAGNAVYLSPTTAGAYTTTKPSAPDQLVVLGWIERVSTTVGSIYVKVDNGYELEELHDVLITSPTTGQALIYESLGNLWVNGVPAYANTANSVSVANVSGIGNIATINLDGSTSNVLYGNGVFAAIPTVSNVANANYANFSNVANTANSVAGSNVSGNVASATLAYTANIVSANTIASEYFITYVTGSGTQTLNIDNGATSNLRYNPSTNVLTSNIFSGNGTQLSNIPGANVTGTVANANFANYSNIANTANSVSVANVTGIGNIATINLDGNVSNVLSGNGSFVALPTVSANANYANFAGNAFSVDAGNIVGTINLANFATTANSVAGSNVSGEVANANFASYSNVANSANSVSVANVSGIGNIATINLDGNVSNVLSGNGSFVALPTVSANANYANFAGNVVNSAQPNITSLGTLTSLTVSGNISGGNISTTGLANLANVQLKIFEETVLASANTSTSISPDATTGSIFRYTANNNFTFNGMTNAVSGTSAIVIITQDATGNRLLTSTMRFANGTKVLSTTAGAIDIISVVYDGTNYYATLSKGYA